MQAAYQRLQYFLSIAVIVIRDEGIFHVLKACLFLIIELVRYGVFRRDQQFRFQQQLLDYFIHPYNCTWNNERQIEIPIALSFLEQFTGKAILEVGNVLKHYYSSQHDVVDKYEQAEGVVNIDVVNYIPGHRYDYIVSISTLEHVGWDEQPKEPQKVLRAIEHLRSLLNKGGVMLVTLPIGYSPAVDAFLAEGFLKFEETSFYRCDMRTGKWQEGPYVEVAHLPFDFSRHRAAGLVVGIYRG